MAGALEPTLSEGSLGLLLGSSFVVGLPAGSPEGWARRARGGEDDDGEEKETRVMRGLSGGRGSGGAWTIGTGRRRGRRFFVRRTGRCGISVNRAGSRESPPPRGGGMGRDR